jgi:hypothetical protein
MPLIYKDKLTMDRLHHKHCFIEIRYKTALSQTKACLREYLHICTLLWFQGSDCLYFLIHPFIGITVLRHLRGNAADRSLIQSNVSSKKKQIVLASLLYQRNYYSICVTRYI